MFLNQIGYGTVRIEARMGSKISSGTGFFHHFCENDGKYAPAIVTNRHVLENQEQAQIFIHTQTEQKSDPDFGNHVPIEIDPLQSFVRYHPNEKIDLAIISAKPLINAIRKLNKEPFYRCTSNEFIARKELLDDTSFVEPILMVGYPNGLWDQKNNLPIVRQGISATPLITDFNGHPQFVIDCACFPGSSGSPVYLNNPHMYYSKKTNSMNMGSSRHALLGILYAGPQHNVKGEIIIETIPTSDIPVPLSRIPNNLGYCLHARLLDDFEGLIGSEI